MGDDISDCCMVELLSAAAAASVVAAVVDAEAAGGTSLETTAEGGFDADDATAMTRGLSGGEYDPMCGAAMPRGWNLDGDACAKHTVYTLYDACDALHMG